MRNVLHSGQDQTGAIFLSTGIFFEKIACQNDTPRLGATHHVWALSAVGAGALFLYCILILLIRTLLILPYVFFNQEGMA